MGKKKQSEETDDPGKGGKVKLVLAAVVLLVAGAGLGSRVLAGGATAAAADEPTTTTSEPPGPITTLDSITLNLADGRFLKLGLSFEVHDGVEYPPESDTPDEITKGFARELDAAINTMSSFTYEQLVAPGGRAEAKRQLLAELERVSDGAIADVLFHEFVMQ